MPDRSEALLRVPLDPNSGVPLKRQLYVSVRAAVIRGELPGGTRLPSSRVLAKRLGVSRTTVIEVYEQLTADGLTRGTVGSGTFVTEIPQALLAAPRASAPRRDARLSVRAGYIVRADPASFRTKRILGAFRNGLPAVDAFPGALWARHLAHAARRPDATMLDYGDPRGYLPLRQAIADRLAVTRAVKCSAEQVIIVDGTQHALDLLAQLLVDPGDRVCVEDPGYPGARRAYAAVGAALVPAPVDDEGLVVDVAEAREPSPRVISVSPSHQYPCALSMSMSRRLALLTWAVKADAWIVEDDFENEFRYDGVPLASLQSLDVDDRVIYIGTFSKTMAPSLRIGYLVVPTPLVSTFIAARRVGAHGAKSIEQNALYHFMESGDFARHIRRMRDLYGERQAVLVEEVASQLSGAVTMRRASSGLHLLARIVGSAVDTAVSADALAEGVVATPISILALEAREQNGLLLGYAVASPREIRAGIGTLARVLDRQRKWSAV